MKQRIPVILFALLVAIAVRADTRDHTGKSTSRSATKVVPPPGPEVKREPCRRDRDCNGSDPCLMCNHSTKRCIPIPNCCHVKRPCPKGKTCGPRFGTGYCHPGAPPKRVCEGGRCPTFPACKHDGHCRDMLMFCVKGVCKACRTDAQCKTYAYPCLFCDTSKGMCQEREHCCTRNWPCRQGSFCRLGLKGDEGICLPGCKSDSACAPGRCVDFACRDRCKTSKDCQSGMWCKLGGCVPGTRP